LLAAGKGGGGVEEAVLFGFVFDDSSKEVGVGFGMYGFNVGLDYEEKFNVKGSWLAS